MDDGPTRIEFKFRSREDVANVCLLKTEKAVLEPLDLPDVGQSVTVAYLPYIEQ